MGKKAKVKRAPRAVAPKGAGKHSDNHADCDPAWPKCLAESDQARVGELGDVGEAGAVGER